MRCSRACNQATMLHESFASTSYRPHSLGANLWSRRWRIFNLHTDCTWNNCRSTSTGHIGLGSNLWSTRRSTRSNHGAGSNLWSTRRSTRSSNHGAGSNLWSTRSRSTQSTGHIGAGSNLWSTRRSTRSIAMGAESILCSRKGPIGGGIVGILILLTLNYLVLNTLSKPQHLTPSTPYKHIRVQKVIGWI